MVAQRSRPFHRGVSTSRPDVPDGLEAHTSGDLGTPPRLEACELIVGVDFTKSNLWTGKDSFNGRCLHDIEGMPNPYMQVLQLVSSKLMDLDDDSKIPCYGFGDVKTGRNNVFSFYPENRPAQGFNALLGRYKEIAPQVKISGPTTFAPLIQEAIREVHKSQMKLHVLLIIADGQISEECIEETKQAIGQASEFPICIVVVGVGDGPWKEMDEFDRAIPGCGWDNFQFIEFNKITNSDGRTSGQGHETQFEEEVMERIEEHCSHAQRLVVNYNKEKVDSIVSEIHNSRVIDPPPHT